MAYIDTLSPQAPPRAEVKDTPQIQIPKEDERQKWITPKTKLQVNYRSFRIDRAPRETLGRKGEVLKMPESTETFPTEVKADYTDYAQNWLQRWIKLEETLSPAEFNTLRSNPENQTDFMLFDQLTKRKENTSIRTIKTDALSELMDTDKGMATWYLKRREEAQRKALGTGALFSMNMDPAGPEALNREDVRLAKGAPLLEIERAIRLYATQPAGEAYGRPTPLFGFIEQQLGRAGGGWNRLNPDQKWKLIGWASAGIVTGGIAGGVIGGPAGALAGGYKGGLLGWGIGGGIGAGLAGLTEGIVRLRKSAEEVIRQPNAKVFEAYTTDARNAAELAKLRIVDGIDPDDYQVVGDRIEFNRKRIAGTRIHHQELGESMLGNVRSLLQFQESIGVRRELQDPLDLGWLIDATQQPAQQGTDLEQQIHRAFNPNRGGIRDAAGENKEIILVPATPGPPPTPDIWGSNPAFNANNLDIAGNLRRYREAYNEVVRNQIEGAFRSILDGKADYRNDIRSEIRAKQEARGKGSKVAGARVKELEGQQETATTDSTNLGRELESLKGGKEKIEELDKQIRDSEDKLAREKLRVAKIPPTSPYTQEEILDKILNEPGFTEKARIDGQETYSSLIEEEVQINKDIDKDAADYADGVIADFMLKYPTPGPRTPPVPDRGKLMREHRPISEKIHERRFANLQRRATNITELLTSIRNNERDLRAQKDKIANRYEAEKRQPAENVLRSIKTDFDTFANWAASGVTAAITENDLRTKSFDDLLKEVNTAYSQALALGTARFDVGWPAAVNSSPANRMRLLHAMSEAKARQLYDTTSPIGSNYDLTVNTWRYTDLDLLALSASEIRAQMAGAATPLGAIPSEAELQDVKAEAVRRFTARENSIQEVIAAMDAKKGLFDKEIEKLNEKGLPAPELAAFDRAVDRYEAIETGLDTVDMNQFLNPDIVDRSTSTEDKRLYVDAENGRSKAYVTMMELMFDHFSDEETGKEAKTSAREAAFKRNETIITQDEMAEELQKYFNLRGGARPFMSFEDTVKELRRRFGLPPTMVAGTPIPSGQTISRKQLADFFADHMVYKVLRPRVTTF